MPERLTPEREAEISRLVGMVATDGAYSESVFQTLREMFRGAAQDVLDKCKELDALRATIAERDETIRQLREAATSRAQRFPGGVPGWSGD